MKYSIDNRNFDLKPLDVADRERVRDLQIRIMVWTDNQSFRDIAIAQKPLPPDLAAEVSAWFIRIAGFPFTEITPRLDVRAWCAVLTAAGFEKLPDGKFNLASGAGTC